MQSKIMYIELKTDGLRGQGRIGRVEFSKTGKTIYYQGRTLIKAKSPLKANYFDESTLEDFWLSNPRKDGKDSVFSTTVDVDKDARIEYWDKIRNSPDQKEQSTYKSLGKSKAEREVIEKGLRRRQMDNGWVGY